ncbi:hypothetical protein G5C65_36050 [Streptomyces sp. SB3404]|uniref:Uncharacterized protein n=1 Tax=Streptomyces boncukensis TaxID=2711219 RepID=A0A6G4X9Y2_9ACTN|nr:hypothetical protein [Streptomyces boncukensis]
MVERTADLAANFFQPYTLDSLVAFSASVMAFQCLPAASLAALVVSKARLPAGQELPQPLASVTLSRVSRLVGCLFQVVPGPMGAVRHSSIFRFEQDQDQVFLMRNVDLETILSVLHRFLVFMRKYERASPFV